MTDRELLELLLQKVTSIEATMATKEELAVAKADVAEMKTEISGMKTDIAGIKTEITGIKADVAEMKTDIANIEGQMIETNQIVKALLHRSEETDAKLEGLAASTASQAAIERIEKAIDRMATDINYLVRKSVEHDEDIRELRRAK